MQVHASPISPGDKSPVDRHARRNERIRCAPGDGIAKAALLELFHESDFRCAYCGVQTYDITADHATPLARGGAHDIANIAPCCRRCNSQKGTKTAEEYTAHLRQLAADADSDDDRDATERARDRALVALERLLREERQRASAAEQAAAMYMERAANLAAEVERLRGQVEELLALPAHEEAPAPWWRRWGRH